MGMSARIAIGLVASGNAVAVPGAGTLPSQASGPAGFVLLEHRQALLPEGATTLNSTGDQASQPRLKPPRALASSPRRRVLPLVREAERRHQLPLGLLDALISAESSYLPFAVSRSGAAGLAQLMPRTALALGVADRFDPMQNIEGGAAYLRQMLDRFGSVSLALAAYNAGPDAVRRAKGIPYNGETPAYVAKVLRFWFSIRAETVHG